MASEILSYLYYIQYIRSQYQSCQNYNLSVSSTKEKQDWSAKETDLNKSLERKEKKTKANSNNSNRNKLEKHQIEEEKEQVQTRYA